MRGGVTQNPIAAGYGENVGPLNTRHSGRIQPFRHTVTSGKHSLAAVPQMDSSARSPSRMWEANMNTPRHLGPCILSYLLAFSVVPPAFGDHQGADIYLDQPYGPFEGDPGTSYAEYAPDPYADEAVGAFFDDLAPYGDWMYLPDLEWVWRPHGVPVGWRPYSDGRWVWSDDGWSWISDWEWGWGPFHYGRWTLFDDDWVWVPDLEWAPAWVVWRHGDGWVGWAPLPPRLPRHREVLVYPDLVEREIFLPPESYCFVEQRVFLEPRVGHYMVPHHRNAALVHRTKNITHYSFQRDRVVNRGLDVRDVERFTHRSVKPYRIIGRDRPVKRGERVKDNEIAMVRPAFGGKAGSRHWDQAGTRTLKQDLGKGGRGSVRVPIGKDDHGGGAIETGAGGPRHDERGATASPREIWGHRAEHRTPAVQREAPRDFHPSGRKDRVGSTKGLRDNSGGKRNLSVSRGDPRPLREKDRGSSREPRRAQPPKAVERRPNLKDSGPLASRGPRLSNPQGSSAQRHADHTGRRDDQRFRQPRRETERPVPQQSVREPARNDRGSHRQNTPPGSSRQAVRRGPDASRSQRRGVEAVRRPQPVEPRRSFGRTRERNT